MPRPDGKATRRTLGRIQRMCCLGLGSEMLMPDLIREVARLIPGRGMFRWAGPDLGISNACGDFPASVGELYFKEFYRSREDEVCKTFGEMLNLPVPNPALWFWQHHLKVDRRTVLRSDHYNVLFRAAEVVDFLVLRVREPGRIHGALYVFRDLGEPPFEPADLELLGSIVGFVTHAMTPAAVAVDVFAESDDRAMFITDRQGRVQHANSHASLLLMMALLPRLSAATNWRSLHEPEPGLARLCGALAAAGDGEVGQPPPVLRRRNASGEFVLRAYWLGPTDGVEQSRQIGITIERRVPRALAVWRRVEQMPLTPREKQLCLLLARDPSRNDLADAMGMAASTAITHLRSVHAKLGVHSRAELLAALQPA